MQPEFALLHSYWNAKAVPSPFVPTELSPNGEGDQAHL